jgi:hypothetical protein
VRKDRLARPKGFTVYEFERGIPQLDQTGYELVLQIQFQADVLWARLRRESLKHLEVRTLYVRLDEERFTVLGNQGRHGDTGDLDALPLSGVACGLAECGVAVVPKIPKEGESAFLSHNPGVYHDKPAVASFRFEALETFGGTERIRFYSYNPISEVQVVRGIVPRHHSDVVYKLCHNSLRILNG